MNRVVNWLKKKADINVVSYSRFGLPGEETDDRPPPTHIYVEAFEDNCAEFRFMGTHATRAATISAVCGITTVCLLFLITMVELDWWHRQTTSSLIGWALLFVCGMLSNWQVLSGVQKSKGIYLVPFIVSYGVLLSFEFMAYALVVSHLVSLPASNFSAYESHHRMKAFLATTFISFAVMIVQLLMLFSVVRCRNYLDKRAIHELEVRIAERSKAQSPQMSIVYVGRTAHATSETAADTSAPSRTLFVAADQLP